MSPENSVGGKLRSSIRYWQSPEGAHLVQAALRKTLDEGATPISDAEIWGVKIGMSGTVYENTLPLSPWINEEGILTLASELSSAQFYKELLDKTPALGILGVYTEITARNISINNSRFITTAIYLSLLAVAQGPRVRELQKSPRRMTFVGEIGDRYLIPPQNPDEFLARVQELVPNPDNSRSGDSPTLFDYLNTSHAFIGDRLNKERVCPAKPLTKLILEQWGRQLDIDPTYRRRFIETITSPQH